MKQKLTPKQEKFCHEYLIDLNATQAAIRAGYSKKTAHVIGYEVLNKTLIQNKISKLRERLIEKSGVTRERVIKELADMAFFNIKTMFDESGEMIPVHMLNDSVSAAINGIDVIGGDGDVQVKKYKISDKNRSLENLAKILGYLEKDGTKESNDTENLVDAMKNFAGKI